MGLYTVRRDLYNSKTASEITSETVWVGDFNEMTLYIEGSASTTTVQGSNADGRDSAIPAASWSLLTRVITPGPDMLNIEPGFRWLRALRSETTAVVLAGKVRV